MAYLAQSFLAPAQARAGLWRTLLGLVLIFAIYAVLNGGAGALFVWRYGLEAAEAQMGALARGTSPQAAALMLASFLPLALAVILVTAILHRRGPRSLLGAGFGRDSARGALALMALSAALGWIALPPLAPNLAPEIWARWLAPALILVAIQTLAEELLFRGYLLQQVAARTGSPRAGLWLSSLAFGAVHYAPDAFGPAWPLPVVAATLFGLIAADLTLRHGNIGAAWGLHLVNNALALLLVAQEGPLSGLALWRDPTPLTAHLQNPAWLALALLPLLLAWGLLRRPAGG